MQVKDNSSIMLSIFKRKGGEGLLTKIIGENNRYQFRELLNNLKGDEKGLIVYFQNKANWILITNKKIIKTEDDVNSSIPYSNLFEVKPAFREEFMAGRKNFSEFTKLILKDKDNTQYIIQIECGKPYMGILRVLDFMSGKITN